MKLLTTQEFSSMLSIAYNGRAWGITLGQALYHYSLSFHNKNLQELITHARESGDYLLTWENDLAVIKYFIDNFVEEF